MRREFFVVVCLNVILNLIQNLHALVKPIVVSTFGDSGSGPGVTVTGLRFCIKLIYVSTFGDPGLSRRSFFERVSEMTLSTLIHVTSSAVPGGFFPGRSRDVPVHSFLLPNHEFSTSPSPSSGCARTDEAGKSGMTLIKFLCPSNTSLLTPIRSLRVLLLVIM